MSNLNIYADYQASLFAFCKTMVTAFAAAGLGSPEVFKFDGHADINEVPDVDIIGPMEFSMDGDTGGQQQATCMLGVSTLRDQNILRLDAMMNIIYDQTQVGQRIPLVNAATGDIRGYLTIMETGVLPVLNTTTRPLKAVALAFGSDVAHVP